MMRKVYVPGYEQWVTLGQYVKAVKMAKDNPDREFTKGLTSWWPVTGREIVHQFMDGVEQRITEGISYSERGIQRLTGEPNGEGIRRGYER
jgi:hypothetical protein